MSWHFVERWLQKVNQHSTLIGKFWITFLIVFRIVVVSSVGDRVYSDEQSEFKCNTLEVGCPNVCFNKFSPISHIRFWSFQIILVTTPSIAFIVYSAHQVKQRPAAKPKTTSQTISPSKKLDSSKERLLGNEEKRGSRLRAVSINPKQEAAEINKVVTKELFGEDKSAFSQHYVLYTLSVIMRTGIEVVFMYLQYEFFGFWIAELYKCSVDPCPNTVDCFVSRPMEKTIFLWFMFVITILCLFLNFLELCYLFWKLCVKKPKLVRKQKHLRYPGSFNTNKPFSYDGPDENYQQANGFSPPSAPPVYGKAVNLPQLNSGQIDRQATDPVQASGHQPLAMSFSMNDTVLPEDNKAQSKYFVSVVGSPSSNHPGGSNNYQVDQPYFTNPRVELTSKNRCFNNYV